MRVRDAHADELLRDGLYRTAPPDGYVLGPAPCHDCHVPLYWAPYAGWRERRYIRDWRVRPRVRYVRQRNGQIRGLPVEVRMTRQFEPHVCTARKAA